MIQEKHLNPIWLKASVLGCLWASSEIVIGSFLHNLHVPFCGNILTAIGIIIMVSVGQVWTERGLFWRAGLVCALMKSISPSAIIFGPMLAIFSEALLMELSTFAFRKNMVASLIGGALAMSWNIVQLLLVFVIKYGTNIIRLYEELIALFQRQLGIVSNNYWWPIEIILSFYLIGGMLSAAIGLYIGRYAGKMNSVVSPERNAMQYPVRKASTESEGTFSISLLFLNIALIIAALTVFNYHKLLFSGAITITLMTFWILIYPKVLRPLKKTGFWVFLILTTVGSAYLFTSISSGKSNGWIIGVEMNLRAIVMILGFAVVGKELRNPVIYNWFNSLGFKQLPYALELSFESLPAVVSTMPGWKEIRKNPIASFSSYMYKANELLELHEKKQQKARRTIIITGDIGEGKTTFIKSVVNELKSDHLEIKGFLAPEALDGKIKTGYDLLNISDNTETEFIRRYELPDAIHFRQFYFIRAGMEMGNTILLKYKDNPSGVLIIDEIGPLELEVGGWATMLNQLVGIPQYKMIWVVRRGVLADVINKWNLKDPLILDISNIRISQAKEIILAFLS